MKATRSSSIGGSRRRSDSEADKASPPLRRSTRDRDPRHLKPETLTASRGSPKSARSSRRRVKRGDSIDDSLLPAPPELAAAPHDSSVIAEGGDEVQSAATKSAHSDSRSLLAVRQNGELVQVHLIVDGLPFMPTTAATTSGSAGKHRKQQQQTPESVPPTRKGAPAFLGQDGNLFYCVVCQEPGDVVCCDGCPHVYHPKCIPKGSASRQSLESDDDPWYCPDCMSKRTPGKEDNRRGAEGGSRRTIKHRCQECQQTRSELSLEPCKVCGVYIHHPPCRGADSPPSEISGKRAILCSSCRAEAALTAEEIELHEKKKRRAEEDKAEAQALARTREGGQDYGEPARSTSPHPAEDSEIQYSEVRARRRTRSIDERRDTEMQSSHALEEEEVVTSGIKRKHPDGSPEDEGVASGKKKKKKKKKGKRKRDSDAHLPSNDDSHAELTTLSSETTTPRRDKSFSFPFDTGPTQGPPTQATPAFHFYLSEQRPKIEKVLSRKHRFFNRLSKGGERNALIAKEAAMQWVKLSSVDQKKYIEMSMHDFGERIIKWKEEKQIRDMLVAGDEIPETADDSAAGEKEPDDDILTFEMHSRLYLGTSVGSKPYKPESDQSHNRVLLDLLRDMRFHPLPMLASVRPESTFSPADSKVCIQHFDIHGPISTSVGDDCLGCTRGWPHYCPVLKRRMPALEHRSKLQPAASSLLSTRVGLGLRPRLERIEITEEVTSRDENDGLADMMQWKEAPAGKELKNVRFLPSGSLAHPSLRADDVVEFIEEVVAMKIPEPSRPPNPAEKHEPTPKKSIHSRGTLPTRHKRTSDTPERQERNGYENINKCGRCRTIILNSKGCLNCRRAQHIINMSKKPFPPTVDEAQQAGKRPEKDSMLKVQTAMLGRIVTKEPIGEPQSDGDRRISSAIQRRRWNPCAVLPPTTIMAPSSLRKASQQQQKPTSQTEKSTSVTQVSETLPKDTQVQVTNTGSSLLMHGKIQGGSDPCTELRPRGSRKTAGKDVVVAANDAERKATAKQHKEETNKLQKRALSIAISGILVGLIRRDPLLLFAQPVTAEGYSLVVKKPIDFGIIRRRALTGAYQSLGPFINDVRLLCDNAFLFNPPGTLYWKTAKELSEALVVMQKRATRWMNVIKNSYASFLRKAQKRVEYQPEDDDEATADPFSSLRKQWPEAVEMLDNDDWFQNLLTADFARTKENESAFYGSLAVRRAARAAEVCLAPYPDTCGVFSTVTKRSHDDDEELRKVVDAKVSKIVDPVQLREIATGREESIVRLMRKVQSRRLERRIGSVNGCARCDGMGLDPELKAVMNADVRWGRGRKKSDGDGDVRVDSSRLNLTTGLASANTRARIDNRREQKGSVAQEAVNDVCVSLRGSKIHGWGLFAEQPFKKGEFVAEYLGECVSLPVADQREKRYQEMRIQDYQFRLDDSQIIDATMKGGLGRYVNHNCNPNCTTKIIPGNHPNQHLRRVLILAQRDIEPREELTYDYQFPLEERFDARIPCNCGSEMCRGFMNWDLPEKGANLGGIKTSKRGANMRDRIRRLGRPLKK